MRGLLMLMDGYRLWWIRLLVRCRHTALGIQWELVCCVDRRGLVFPTEYGVRCEMKLTE